MGLAIVTIKRTLPLLDRWEDFFTIDKIHPRATIVSENMATEVKKIANDFLRDLEERKKRATKTIVHYDFYLQRFIKWLSQNKINHYEQLNVDIIDKYKKFIENFNDPVRKTFLKKTTSNYYLIALRGFVDFASTKGLKGLKISDINLSKISKNTLAHLQKDELVMLLEAPLEVNQNKIITLRDKAILEILFCTGVKVSTLAQAQKEQIKKSIYGKLIFQTLDKYKNELVLSNQATAAIQKYLTARKDKNSFLFIGHDNAIAKRKKVQGLSSRSLERTIERYAKHAKIKKRVTPQLIRNTYLVNKLLLGEDIKILKKQLGYSNIDTLKEYLRNI